MSRAGPERAGGVEELSGSAGAEGGRSRRRAARRGGTLLGLAISVLLLLWTFRDVSLGEVTAHVRGAEPLWLGAMVVTATASFLPRASRWQALLLPVIPATSFDSRFGGVAVGAMANNLLPARLGEFARAFAFSRVEPVGMSAAFGSLVVERVFDGLVLAGFLALGLLVPGSPVAGDGLVRKIAAGGAVVFVGAWGLLWLLARRPDRVLLVFERTAGRLLSPDLTERGVEILGSFIEGLGAFHDARVFLRTLAWTVVVWAVASLSVWCGFRAFGIEAPGATGAVFLQSLIGFAVAIPSSPGFFGPFEAACRIGLGFYGVEAARTVSFAAGYHVMTFVPITLIGLWYVRRMGLRWAQIGRSEELVGASVEREGPAAGGPG